MLLGMEVVDSELDEAQRCFDQAALRVMLHFQELHQVCSALQVSILLSLDRFHSVSVSVPASVPEFCFHLSVSSF